MFKRLLLKEIAAFNKGSSEKMIPEGSKYPVVSGGKQTSKYTDTFNRSEGSITIAVSHSCAVGHVNYWDSPIYARSFCYTIDCDQSMLIPKYLYYYLVNIQRRLYLLNISPVGIMPRLDMTGLGKVEVIIPSLDYQRRVVSLLDSLTDKSSQLTDILKKEMGLIKEQYVYYREHILDNPLSFFNIAHTHTHTHTHTQLSHSSGI